jgi:outer membrane receptor protein involved in Fe transport
MAFRGATMTKMKGRVGRIALFSVSVLALSVGAGRASAQTADEPATNRPQPEQQRHQSTQDSTSSARDAGSQPDIVVTGTRTDSTSDIPTPVTIVGAGQLQEAARPNVVAALNDLPQFKASWSPQITGGSFVAAAWSVDLRGLGSSRTLVLFEGRRLVSSFPRPDYSVIPSVLVNRVDVVTGSASAAYGSNAVAGVVNIFLDDDLEGLRFGGHAGISSRGDVGEREIEGAGGLSFADGRGHILVGGEYVDNDGARPKTSRANVGRWAVVTNPNAGNGQLPLILAPDVGFANASLGGLILSGVNAGRTFNPDGTLRPFDAGRVSGTTSIGGEGPANDDVSSLVAPSTRYSLLGRISYELSDALKITADVMHARIFNDYPFLPDPSRGNITISIDNAFLPAAIRGQMQAAGQTSFTFGRFNSDFALTRIAYSRRTTQAGVQLDGRLGGGWRWSAYYTHGTYDEDIDLSNLRIAANFANAVDSLLSPTTGQPICRIALTNPGTNCVPIDLFGFGAPSQAARDYVLGTGVQRLHQTLDAGGLTLRGTPFDLGAGPVSVALGVEARREAINQRVGDIDAVRGFAFTNFGPIHADNTTKEAFGEVLVPIVRDLPGLRLLQFNGAARITDDATGSIWSWKLGLTDEVADGVRLRFTHSRDIRAPNLNELYAPPLLSLANISDPQTGTTYQIRTFTGGNSLLVPERSLTTTAGITLAPRAVPRLRISADYFNINIANAISVISAQNIINACDQGRAEACSAITRGGSGLIDTVTATQLNFTRLHTSGIDALLEYSVPVTDSATVRLRAGLTWTHEYETDDGLAEIDYLGSQGTIAALGVPKVSANGALFFETRDFVANIRARFLSAGQYNTTQAIENGRIPAYTYFDLGLRWTVTRREGESQAEIFANVNNLFDKDPPPGSTTSPYYDVVGRYFTVGARLRF